MDDTVVILNGNTYSFQSDFTNGGHLTAFPNALKDFLADAGKVPYSASASVVEVGTGTKAFTLAPDRPFALGSWVMVASAEAPTAQWMYGQVTGRTSGVLTVDVTIKVGSGSAADWVVSMAAPLSSLDIDVEAALAAVAAAEAAAAAAQNYSQVYASTAAGLAGTVNGDYFTVPSVDDAESFLLYLNDGGSATLVKTYPSAEGISVAIADLLITMPNELPNGDFRASSPERRSGSVVVDLDQEQLRQYGLYRGIQWGAGSEYIRHRTGTDQTDRYLFAAFFVYSENPANLLTSAVAFGENAAGDTLSPTAISSGNVPLSSELRLVWRYVQITGPDAINILVGHSSTPSGSTRYASGFFVATSVAAIDVAAAINSVLFYRKARSASEDVARGQNVARQIPTNLLGEGGSFIGNLTVRSGSAIVPLTQAALVDRGYRYGMRWREDNDFVIEDAGASLLDKYVLAGFLVYSTTPGNLLPAAQVHGYDEVGGGIEVIPKISDGFLRITDRLRLVWEYAQMTVASDHIALGSSFAPVGLTRYATGFFCFVSDDPIDIDTRTFLLRSRLAFDAYRKDIADIALYGTSGAAAAIVSLAGEGNVESYVQSNLSGVEIKSTFVAFPGYVINAAPAVFNFRKTFIDGVEVLNGPDDVAPYRAFGDTVGANHGYSIFPVTATGHGKTSADHGAIYANGGVNYLLVSISGTNKVYLTHRDSNTSAPMPTGTYTHVSGGTNTADLVVTLVGAAQQWFPPFRNRQIDLFVDGTRIDVREGTFAYRDSVQFVESYEILPKSEIVAWWQIHGTADGLVPDGDPAFRVTIIYEYDRDGQCTIYSGFFSVDGFDLQDIMFLQAAAGGFDEYYVPKALPFTHDGEPVNYALKESATRTSAGGLSSVLFTPARCEPDGILVDRVMALKPGYGFAMGYLPVGSTGVAQRRIEATVKALEIRGNTNKLYLSAVDKGSITLAAGAYFSTIGYRHVFVRSAERLGPLLVRTQGADYLFVDWHDTALIDQVPLPPELAGRDFEVQEKTDNVTLYSTTLTGFLSVGVAAAGSYGYLRLKIT